MPSSRNRDDEAVLVCGLGRFGSATAAAMVRLGRQVLAIDRDPRLVQEFSSRLTRVVEADTTNADALAQLGCGEFPVAVVGIGTSIESSVLTCSNLVELGIGQIWAKAITPAHGTILERIGVHKVIYPESDAGERVAHLVSGKLIDYIEFDDGFAIAKMRAPMETQGFTLGESKVRQKYGVTVVGVKSPGRDFTYAQADTRVSSQDLLIVSGSTQLVERFAARP
ncbi:MAG TPA: TrkA family potassium uptake protein [Kineosporiaceae bacterium]|nr:TrkA family potassium uptake protein [Kineosporiaceae bacterium]